MKVVFIGVVSIGWHCLRALLESGADVGVEAAEAFMLVREIRV